MKGTNIINDDVISAFVIQRFRVSFCAVFITKIPGSHLKSQLFEFSLSSSYYARLTANSGLFVYLSAPAPDGGPCFHGGQQLANRIYSCIGAPAVQMYFMAQSKQNTTLGQSADMRNVHVAP